VATSPQEPTVFFTGKPYVDGLGYVFKYRNYNPELCRWQSADPSGFPDGANNQIYAPCPTSGVDPTGLDAGDQAFSFVYTGAIKYHKLDPNGQIEYTDDDYSFNVSFNVDKPTITSNGKNQVNWSGSEIEVEDITTIKNSGSGSLSITNPKSFSGTVTYNNANIYIFKPITFNFNGLSNATTTITPSNPSQPKTATYNATTLLYFALNFRYTASDGTTGNVIQDIFQMSMVGTPFTAYE